MGARSFAVALGLCIVAAAPSHGGAGAIRHIAQSRRVEATAFVNLNQDSEALVAPDFGDFDAFVEAEVFVDEDCRAYASAAQTSMLLPSAVVAEGEVVATREFGVACTSGASATSALDIEIGLGRRWFMRMRGEVAGGSLSFTRVQIEQKGMPIIRHQPGGPFNVVEFDDLFTLSAGSYTFRAQATCNATGGACGWYRVRLELAGDLDGDDHVDGDDLVALLAGWGDCPGEDCDTDLDSSGATGFEDLLVLLVNWTESF